MVGTLPPSLQSQPPAASSSLAPAGAAGAGGVVATTTVAATSSGGGGVALAEEEALKRNTDCVYFLASPLTCKKGSECEYRHSDIARVNPRDCWYWLHGNCLNPKCGFRHPPLDGLLGTQMPNPVVTSVPASQPATTPAASVSYASGKQGVPCVFFQKGICLKGDWCPFLHASNSANNKQSQAAIPASEPPVFKKTFGSLEKGTQDKKITQTSVLKSAELTTQAKPILKFESAPAKKETNNNKRLPPSGVDNELRGYRPVDTANNGNRVSWTTRVQQQPLPLQVNDHTTTLNNKDLEEPSREPSPGFDVLVDNELGDSDYYHTEDHFGRSRDHEEMNEYYDGRSGDYGSLLDADRDIYRDSRGYDSYEQLQGQYGWEQRRSSSERMSGVLAYPEQRRYGMADSPDQIDESDLRHHLSKHRRVNGLRSVINHDYPHERPDERGHQGSRRDLRQDRDRRDSSLSSRLRGRIKIPGASSSPTDVSDLQSDRETERRRERSGLSPGGSQVPSRLRDRIKEKVQEDFNNDGRNNRGLRMRTDMISDNNIDFAAPKSLAELKSSSKSADGSDQQSMGKRKYSKIDYQQQAGEDLSFEGPKPLEEILKRKRKSDSVVSGSGMTSQYAEDNSQRKADESSKQVVHFSPSQNDSSLPHKENEEYKLASGVKSVSEGAQSGDSQSLSHGKNEGEVEEGMIVDDATKVREPEAYDHGDEDFDYEQGDGDNYNVDEGENGDAEEEYLDDEDGDDGDDDDFAKKMGVMY